MKNRRGCNTCLIRLLIFGLILAAMSFGALLVAEAAGESGGFALSPTEDRGFFDYTAQAGEWIPDQILISNSGPEPIELRVFKSAGHTTADGDWNLRLTDGVASWLQWSDGIYEVPAESALLVDFAVAIPEGTPDGEYFAGLVAEPNNPPPTTGEGFVISVIPQSGVAVRVTVGNPDKCAVAFGNFELLPSGDSLLLKMDLENQGNVHFEGSGNLTVSSGSTVQSSYQTKFPLRYFLAGDSTRYQLVIPLLEAGEYEFSANMESSNFPGCNASSSQNLTAVEPTEPESEPDLLAELFEGLRGAAAEGDGAGVGVTGTKLDSRAWLGLGLAAGGVVFGTAWIIFLVWLIRRTRKGNRHTRGLPPQSDPKRINWREK